MNITETAIRALQTQREVLDQAIQALQRVTTWGQTGETSPDMAQRVESQESPTERVPPQSKPEGRLHQGPPRMPFHEGESPMTGWEACRLVIRRSGEAMSVPEIVTAFEADGMPIKSTAKRAYISTAMRRREDIFVRVGGQPSARWGLKEWMGHRKQ